MKDDLIKTMPSDYSWRITGSPIKIESLDNAMKILSYKPKDESVWNMLGWYDCKIKIPRKKKSLQEKRTILIE